MAKNKVEIDVKVDDKGTTKKVGLGASRAAEGLDKTARSARSVDRNLKGAAQASANGSKNFSKMSQSRPSPKRRSHYENLISPLCRT